MRRPAADADLVSAHSLAGNLQRAAVRARLADQDGRNAAGLILDQDPRGRRSEFFVAGEQQRHRVLIVEVLVIEQHDGRQRLDDTRLHVKYAGPRRHAVGHRVRPACERAERPDGVEVAEDEPGAASRRARAGAGRPSAVHLSAGRPKASVPMSSSKAAHRASAVVSVEGDSQLTSSARHSRIHEARAAAAARSWSAGMGSGCGRPPGSRRGRPPGARRGKHLAALAAGQDEVAAGTDPFRAVPVRAQIGLGALRAALARDLAGGHLPTVGAGWPAGALRLAPECARTARRYIAQRETGRKLPGSGGRRADRPSRL